MALEMTDMNVVEGNVVDGRGGLYMKVRDEEFEIRRVSISYPMMKFAQARRKADVHIPEHLDAKDPRRVKAEEKRNEAGMEIMALLLDATMILLKPYERSRFDEYMNDLSMSDGGLKPGELETAISEAMGAVGGADEEGKEVSMSSDSSNGSPTTSQNVQVISSQPVTGMDMLSTKTEANAGFVHDAT